MWIGFKKEFTRVGTYLICRITHDVIRWVPYIVWLIEQFYFHNQILSKKNLEMLVEVLLNNGYPLEMIFNSRIKKFLSSGVAKVYKTMKNMKILMSLSDHPTLLHISNSICDLLR